MKGSDFEGTLTGFYQQNSLDTQFVGVLSDDSHPDGRSTVNVVYKLI